MELEVSFRLFSAIELLQITFNVDQPTCIAMLWARQNVALEVVMMALMASAAMIPRWRGVDLATLRRSLSPRREEPIPSQCGGTLATIVTSTSLSRGGKHWQFTAAH